MHKLIMPIFIFCMCLLTLFANIASAGEFKKIELKGYTHGITKDLKQLVFTEGTDHIIFSVRKISNIATQFVVTRNDSKSFLYGTVLQNHEKYGSVSQIYHEKTGRYFYLVHLFCYPDGGFYNTTIMGLDPSDKKWHIFLDAKDYYHPDKYKSAHFWINKTNDLLLSFGDDDMGFNIPTQRYILYWNDAEQKFDYVDKGFGVHQS